MALLLLLWTGYAGLSAQEEGKRPVFLFPSVQTTSENGNARRRAAARREGESALSLHDPQLAEQKFQLYCELTPANLPEAGQARLRLAEAQFAFAESLRRQGAAEAAEKKYREALQTIEYFLVLPDIHPEAADREQLELLRAQTLACLDRSEEALKLLLAPEFQLTSEARSNDLHWQALRLAARLQLARREWTAALALLNPYFEANPPERRDAELLMLRADAELARAEYAPAAEHYRQLLALLPQGPAARGEIASLDQLAALHRLRALVGLAESASPETRNQRLAEALELYRQLAPARPQERNPEWGTALWCLANETARKNAQADLTIELLRAAWELLPVSDPHFVEAAMLLAQCQRQEHSPEALATLRALRQACPDSPQFGEFSLQLAEYLMEDGAREEAAQLFDQLAHNEALKPAQRARAAFGVAECLTQAGQLEAAQSYYRQAAENAEPRQAVTALLQAAQAAKEAGQPDLAVALQVEVADRFGQLPAEGTEESDEALKLRHRAAEARLEAAIQLRQRNQAGDFAAAIALIDAFLAATPDSPRRAEARLEKALMQEKMAGEDVAALAEVQHTFQELAFTNANDERIRTIAFFETARIALLRKDYPIALTALAQYQESFPQSPHALRACHRRILLMLQLGQDDEARALAAELLQKWPGSAEAAQITLLLADFALGAATPQGYQEALELYRQIRPPQYSDTAMVAQARYETANTLFLLAQLPNVEELITPPENYGKNAFGYLLDEALATLNDWQDEAAPSLAPNAQMLWGELLSLQGNPAAAREKFQRAYTLAGNSPLGLAALGRLGEMLLTEAGGNGDATQSATKLQKAIEAFAELLRNARDDELLALAHFRTAQCLRELGRQKDAVRNYQDALRHFKEICLEYESSPTPERSPRYYTLAVFELADLAEEMAEPIYREQAIQFLQAYAQHAALPFAAEAAARAKSMQK